MGRRADEACLLGVSDPEHSLPGLDGNHCGCQNVPPGSRYGQSRIHACHEGQLDHLALGLGVCAAVPTRAYLGSILQYRGVRHWDLHQRTYEKEEVGRIEEEGRQI